MAKRRVPSHHVVFVVVEHEGHVLLVREAKHGQLWYAPAGGLEAGETVAEAAVRETLEESGVAVEPIGLVRVDQHWFVEEGGGLFGWWRFLVRARPVASLETKRAPDHHSLEARWVRPEQIADYPLRGAEVTSLVRLALDGPIVPLAREAC